MIGSYWHGHPRFYAADNIHPVSKKKYGELYRKTLQKAKDLRNAGYAYEEIWEHEYTKICKKPILDYEEEECDENVSVSYQ